MDSQLRVNPGRWGADYDSLAQFGATGDGGVNRPTFSEAHLAARAGFREQSAQAGLEPRVDGAGNECRVIACGPAGTSTLLLDSVPNGERFDGAHGVLAAGGSST